MDARIEQDVLLKGDGCPNVDIKFCQEDDMILDDISKIMQKRRKNDSFQD